MFGYDWPRLHAALNDLPAALLVAAVLFDLIAAATRRAAFRQASLYVLVFGALGGVAAVLSGIQAEHHIDHGDAVHRVMETHELLAFVTLGIFGVLALWRLLRENKMGAAERAITLAVSLGGAGVLIATSMYGGRLVFEHAAGIPTPALQEEIQQRGAGHHHEAGEEHEDEHAPAAPTSSPATDSAAPAPTHVDPPGTPPHTHGEPKSDSHTHPPGTPAHEH
jgi:uncharacterized membrane protein